MKSGEISDYLDYWMEGDEGFSAILGDANNAVEDVEYYNHEGFPRSAVYMDKGLILLFPPFQTGFDYTQIDYK